MFLGETLEEIQEELVKKDKVRQEIQTTMRKVTRLSKQAIFLVHKAMLKEAKEILTKAERILANVRGLSGRYPDLFYMGTVDSGFQEYTEASILLSLVKEGCFVSFKEINVPKASYVLGLADVVGELRRRALNFLRKGKAQEAEKCLELMEIVYEELMNFDELHFLVHGLRRKCDVARRIIEATRGDVTIEVRRSLLGNSIGELKKVLEAEKK